MLARMSNAESIDLRERAVAFGLEGGQKKVACQSVNIGRDPLYRWVRHDQSDGQVTRKARGKYGARQWEDAVLVKVYRDPSRCDA